MAYNHRGDPIADNYRATPRLAKMLGGSNAQKNLNDYRVTRDTIGGWTPLDNRDAEHLYAAEQAHKAHGERINTAINKRSSVGEPERLTKKKPLSAMDKRMKAREDSYGEPGW